MWSQDDVKLQTVQVYLRTFFGVSAFARVAALEVILIGCVSQSSNFSLMFSVTILVLTLPLRKGFRAASAP